MGIPKSWAIPKFDIYDPSLILYVPFWRPDMVSRGGSIVNGTGTMDVNPQGLAVGANTITATGAGTFVIRPPYGGSCISGTAIITGSPVTLNAGVPTTVTAEGTGNFTVTPANKIYSLDRTKHSLTITGATWGYQGRNFDGNDDRIVLASNITKGLTALSVIVWVNPTDKSASHTLLGDFTSFTDFSLIFDVKDIAATGTYQNCVWLNGETASYDVLLGNSTTHPYGQWAMMGFTWAPNTVSHYFNGESDGTDTYTDTQLETTVTYNTTIGSYYPGAGGQNVLGMIGEVIIYNRVLSAGEMMRLYQSLKWRYK